jgi:hypothetical protein
MISDADQDALRARAVELVAVFLEESNPASWPSSKTKEGRGDRVWLKKSATQTLIIIEQIRQILARQPAGPPADTDEESADARMIAEAEAMANQILGRTNGPKPPH